MAYPSFDARRALGSKVLGHCTFELEIKGESFVRSRLENLALDQLIKLHHQHSLNTFQPKSIIMCWKQEYKFAGCGHRVVVESVTVRKCPSAEAYGHPCIGSFENPESDVVKKPGNCPSCQYVPS
ncbi:hypothetical protein F4825DRAFT_455840 [Nemania diffusa]|nr:hypothetical protein F4825DRAFT_455840 [Nemania diffusa]